MKELISLETANKVIMALGVLWVPLAAGVGYLLARRSERRASLLRRAAVAATIGPVAIGLWRLYLYLVRFDPQTGYFGLVSLKVLGLCLLIFAAVGALYGRLLSTL
jgi:hypothetical protein